MDAALRQLEMMRLIPRAPRSITVTRLAEKLEDEGFAINVRTIQRDLNALTSLFDLRNKAVGRTQKWFWGENAELIDIPGMSP
ncbi:MAG: WYL domain-containing protein, partial [Gammaproteobacteria bacterium]|nr:WYL domain-containing protein [Gammaproteobacteria bacterium]MBT5370408.1 WYL domain-containing protein [Gammaproteobacteria bacterium]